MSVRIRGSVRIRRLSECGGCAEDGDDAGRDQGDDEWADAVRTSKHSNLQWLALACDPGNRRKPTIDGDASLRTVGKSSIAKHFGWGPRSPTAVELGRRVRVRRRRLGLTQSQLGQPLSRSYVSALESGATMPSLGTLWLFSQRLGVTVGELIDGVNRSDPGSYTAGDEPSADRHIAPRPARARPGHRGPNP